MFCFHLVETILEETFYRVNMKMKLLKNIHFVSYTDDDLVEKNRKACSKKLSFENHFYLIIFYLSIIN